MTYAPSIRHHGRRLALAITAVLAASAALAEEPGQLPPARKEPVVFRTDVAPIFQKHCYECHGPSLQESGLRLDQRASLLAGGDSGDPAIVVGDSAKSLLIRYTAGIDENLVMPPEGERLTAQQVSTLRAWIDQGAKWPEGGDAAASVASDHWSLQPVVRPPIPPTESQWPANPIDAFILDRLRQAGITPSPPADRVMLARRLYLDMLGLPPTPRQLAQFVADDRPDACRRLVDQVLHSPRYGERWARHWLDVVRFAETNGFETNRERPTAYRYRDYVIQSLNHDIPYDRFIKEQLAGDALGADVATGFLVAGPYDIVKSPDINLTLMQRQNELDDMVNTTGTALLALTLGCARCHSHKFDPIPQTDYYAVQAVFAGVQHGERQIPHPQGQVPQSQIDALQRELADYWQQLARLLPASGPAINAARNIERFPPVSARFVRFIIERANASEPCLDELEVFTTATPGQDARNIALASAGTVATASGVYLDGRYPIHQLHHVNDGLYGNDHSWISKAEVGAWLQLELPQSEIIERIEWGRDRNGQYKDRVPIEYRIEVADELGSWQLVASSASHAPIDAVSDAAYRDRQIARLAPADQPRAAGISQKIDQLQQRLERLDPGPRSAYAGVFAQPGPTYRLYRGEPQQPLEQVAPGAVAAVGPLRLSLDAPEQTRRLALANWIADHRNPLTARVIVNRLWHYHFGTGIVPTPSDFGRNGQPPSHPELLDWLASELMDHGWSIKHIHRLILYSATYQQSSLPRADGLDRDAACQLLWRFPPRRLEAEAIRDSILQVSGVLDLRMGGEGFSAFDVQLENVRHYFPLEEFGPSQWRRMIYMTKVRMEQDGVFGVFDCPDGGQVMPRRGQSTTPLQAMNLLNSQFVLQQAELMAARLQQLDRQPRRQVRQAFLLCFGREPTEAELVDSLDLLDRHSLPSLCRALLNSNEFLFIP